MKRKVSQYIYFISFLILGSLAYSSSANIAQTIHASTYILPEPDSFLDSFNGSDINGIEDVVKKLIVVMSDGEKMQKVELIKIVSTTFTFNL